MPFVYAASNRWADRSPPTASKPFGSASSGGGNSDVALSLNIGMKCILGLLHVTECDADDAVYGSLRCLTFRKYSE
jgi:hypothetical protein